MTQLQNLKKQIGAAYASVYIPGAIIDLPRIRRACAASGLLHVDNAGSDIASRMPLDHIAQLFAYCGGLDLDLRDLPGLGHGRLLTLVTKKSPAQKKLIETIAGGDGFCAIAITEEQGGSDLHGIACKASAYKNGYRISGKKSFIARLNQATHVVVFARTGHPYSKNELQAFILSVKQDGIKQTTFSAMGLHGASFGEIHFNDVFVPQSMCIGLPGSGMDLFARHFTFWRTAMAAAAIGCARQALKQTLLHLTGRNAFSGPIGRFTHLQQELARHTARLHMSWELIIATMRRIENGEEAFIFAAMAKAEAIESALEAADWSMRVHGARGYSTLIDIEKRYRDLLGLRIADGPTDVLRGQVARSLLGDSIYEASLGRSRANAREHPSLLSSLLGPD